MPFVKPPCSLSGPKGISLPSFIPRDKTIQGYHWEAKEDGEKRQPLSCWDLWGPETGVADVTEWSGLLRQEWWAGRFAQNILAGYFPDCRNLPAIIHSTNAAPFYFPCRWIHNVHWIPTACAWACNSLLYFHLKSTMSVNRSARTELPDIWKILFFTHPNAHKPDFFLSFFLICESNSHFGPKIRPMWPNGQQQSISARRGTLACSPAFLTALSLHLFFKFEKKKKTCILAWASASTKPASRRLLRHIPELWGAEFEGDAEQRRCTCDAWWENEGIRSVALHWY